jgi:hypothetical protein
MGLRCATASAGRRRLSRRDLGILTRRSGGRAVALRQDAATGPALGARSRCPSAWTAFGFPGLAPVQGTAPRTRPAQAGLRHTLRFGACADPLYRPQSGRSPTHPQCRAHGRAPPSAVFEGMCTPLCSAFESQTLLDAPHSSRSNWAVWRASIDSIAFFQANEGTASQPSASAAMRSHTPANGTRSTHWPAKEHGPPWDARVGGSGRRRGALRGGAIAQRPSAGGERGDRPRAEAANCLRPRTHCVRGRAAPRSPRPPAGRRRCLPSRPAAPARRRPRPAARRAGAPTHPPPRERDRSSETHTADQCKEWRKVPPHDYARQTPPRPRRHPHPRPEPRARRPLVHPEPRTTSVPTSSRSNAPVRATTPEAWGPPFLKTREGGDTQDSAYYLAANRNKRSITLDLACEAGQQAVRRAGADLRRRRRELQGRRHETLRARL